MEKSVQSKIYSALIESDYYMLIGFIYKQLHLTPANLHEDNARIIVDAMETADVISKQELIDTFGLEDELRICDHCWSLMDKGYYLDGYHACSDECRDKLCPDYKQLCEEDSDEYYYTEW